MLAINILIATLADSQLCMKRQIRDIIARGIREKSFAVCACIAVFRQNRKDLIHLADVERILTADA